MLKPLGRTLLSSGVGKGTRPRREGRTKSVPEAGGTGAEAVATPTTPPAGHYADSPHRSPFARRVAEYHGLPVSPRLPFRSSRETRSHPMSSPRRTRLDPGGDAELTRRQPHQAIVMELLDLATLRGEEKKMTKSDLVEQVADVIGPRVTKRDCGLVVDAFLAAVKDTLARGDHIEIRGFGTFKVRHRKARTARNPRTGESVEVPPRAAPVFTPSRHLRSQVDRGSGVSGAEEPFVAAAEP